MSDSPLRAVHVADAAFFRGFEALFGSWRFPVFALTAIAVYETLLFWMLLAPIDPDSPSAFAEEFRKWCFGYDPATGTLEAGYVIATITSPMLLVGLLLIVWWQPLRQVLSERPRAIVPWAAGAAMLASGSMAMLSALGAEPARGELAFPADRLRTGIPAPDFRLIGHDGAPIALADLRGRVVLLTAVYASCGFT